MKKLCFIIVASISFSLLSFVSAQESKLYMPKNFKRAYDEGTRSMDGKPGKNYWQNRADYIIDVSLEPETRIISGNETIHYTNNSPDDLTVLLIKLFPNLYKEGNSRDDVISVSDEFSGVEISRLVVGDKKLNPSPRAYDIRYIHNDFYIYLPDMLPSGGEVKVSISWEYTLNAKSHLREGQVDPSTFFVAYFFPRIAVYDDIDGWDDSQYTGTPEFYNDFANFDVSISVPENYLMWATGELQNPEKVLSARILKRYRQARISDEVFHIIRPVDLLKGKLTKHNSRNIWHYKAENVPDFAFGTSDHYLWDGSSLVVDLENERRVFIDAAYDVDSRDFFQVAQIARNSIEYMSFNYPGVPFPYPCMTVFNGLSEMEYPMMVNDISLGDLTETLKLTTHEIFHSYFPFYTGLNETKYGWMDEGLTCYGESVIATALDEVPYAGFYFSDAYQAYAGNDYDVPLFVCSEFLKSPVYYGNSYPKAATFFRILHNYLGDDVYMHALREFVSRWKGKHPIPHDLLYAFADDSGEDLEWLFNPWIFEFGYVDLALESMEKTGSGYRVGVSKKGAYPAPFDLVFEFENGEEQRISKNVSIWKPDRKLVVFEIETDQVIKQISIDNEAYFDVDLSNNSL